MMCEALVVTSLMMLDGVCILTEYLKSGEIKVKFLKYYVAWEHPLLVLADRRRFK